MEFKNYTLKELDTLVQEGKTTYSEIRAYFLERITKYDDDLGTFNLVDTETKATGLPIAIKDIFCEIGVRTTAASKMLKNYVPPYESTVTDRLKKAGFQSIGKTNMDEFAMGGSGENSAFKNTKNPWDISRVPGGSSSGSAAAVAAGLVPAALGTDTGGSIRQPASMCGVVGFKPGYGRNSRNGVIAMASSLDCPGYFTRSVRDAAWLYECTAGYDPKDATSLDEPVKIDENIWNKKDLKGIKIGIPKEYFSDGIDPNVRQVIDDVLTKIRENGGEIIELSLPHTQHGVSVYYTIAPAEIASNIARYDGIRFGELTSNGSDIIVNRTASLGDEVQRRSLIGSFVLSSGFYDAYYKKANAVRELIRNDFKKAFEEVHVIFTPTAPTVAFKLDEKEKDPLTHYLQDIFTVPASLAGIPGLVVPVGFASPLDDASVELPVGAQILGPVLGEEKVLEVGNVLERMFKETISAKNPNIW